MDKAPEQFTIAQIAAGVGKSPRIVRRWLGAIHRAGIREVRGNPAATYAIESLPEKIQQALNDAADRRGTRSAAELLSAAAETWRPEIPWNEVCPEHQAEALTLQRALLPMIARRNDATLPSEEFESIGAEIFERETGRKISRERWRYLFDRTLRRAGSSEQFHRPELFLPGNLKSAAPTPAPQTAEEFEPLNLCIANFRDATQPSVGEIDALWMETIELFSELSNSVKPKAVKRRLLMFLWQRAPFLAKSQNALRVNFDRKVKTFRAQGENELALLDGRALKRGDSRAVVIPQDDVDRLAWHSARNCGGRTAQAVRELAALGEHSGLSNITLDLINNSHSRKSHVNRRLFERVHRDAELIAPQLLGKKAKDDATPSLRRDYSKLRSMDVLTADDFTMPVYMAVPDGKGWWVLTRGQCLLMMDVRSLKIIAWSLQPERNYNALVIRTLMNRTCRQWGLPHAWLFENGIWRNANLVKGAPREWAAGKSWGELKPGWAQLGVRFIHAKKARSKPAELVGGLLQNLMERVPGYCGRDERRDCPEATRRNKLAVEARRIEPQGIFLSFDAWHEELGRLINAYNASVQQGEILQGLSPDQAFETFWPHDDPPMKLDASCWHLLAHYVSERIVGVDGIKFRIGNQPFVYRDENSSDLRGQTVRAWFDPECSELLGVTDLNGRNPRLIQRSNPVDFLAALDRNGDAGRAYRDELSKVAGHNSYPKARYEVLKGTFEPSFRKNLVSPKVAHVAQTFEADRSRIEEKQREKADRAATTTRRARRLGLQPSVAQRGDALTDEGMEMMLRAERAAQSKPSTPGEKQ